jgi:hypothetical protein
MLRELRRHTGHTDFRTMCFDFSSTKQLAKRSVEETSKHNVASTMCFDFSSTKQLAKRFVEEKSKHTQCIYVLSSPLDRSG